MCDGPLPTISSKFIDMSLFLQHPLVERATLLVETLSV